MEWKGGGGPTGFSAFKRCSYSWQMPLSASPIVSKSLKVLDAWEAARFAAVSAIKLMGGWVLLIPPCPSSLASSHSSIQQGLGHGFLGVEMPRIGCGLCRIAPPSHVEGAGRCLQRTHKDARGRPGGGTVQRIARNWENVGNARARPPTRRRQGGFSHVSCSSTIVCLLILADAALPASRTLKLVMRARKSQTQQPVRDFRP